MALGYSAARFALRGFSEGLRGYLQASGITVSLAVFGKVESSYWKNNPGSEKRIPKSTPFMPTLTTNQVGNYIVKIIEKNKRILIKPGIFKILFWSFLHWLDQIAERMNKTV
jgi:short-subunit dehydrogenase